MKIGLEIGEFGWEGGPSAVAGTLADIARTADDAGFALIGVGDHLWQGPHAGGEYEPMLEAFGVLSLLAAHTRTCELAPVVAGVHFRAPALLAKSVTTLDVLSGGRAMLGIGAGWYADEATGSGIPFPSTAERFEMVEETIRICRQMWDGDHGDEQPFEGRHYRLERALNVPQNISRPRIMIGGGGRQRTLRLVAQYADACNLFPMPDLAETLDVLRGHCDAVGRDYDEIEKTCVVPLPALDDGAGVGEVLEQLEGLAGLGVTTAIFLLTGSQPVRQVEILGKRVVPAAAGF